MGEALPTVTVQVMIEVALVLNKPGRKPFISGVRILEMFYASIWRGHPPSSSVAVDPVSPDNPCEFRCTSTAQLKIPGWGSPSTPNSTVIVFLVAIRFSTFMIESCQWILFRFHTTRVFYLAC